jgi:hypothetical protein
MIITFHPLAALATGTPTNPAGGPRPDPGTNGGSGGGGGANPITNLAPGLGTPSQGNPGGSGFYPDFAAGGGGGFSEPGAPGRV